MAKVLQCLFTINGTYPVGHHEIIAYKPVEEPANSSGHNANYNTHFFRFSTQRIRDEFLQTFNEWVVEAPDGTKLTTYAKASDKPVLAMNYQFVTQQPRQGQMRWLRWVWHDCAEDERKPSGQ